MKYKIIIPILLVAIAILTVLVIKYCTPTETTLAPQVNETFEKAEPVDEPEPEPEPEPVKESKGTEVYAIEDPDNPGKYLTSGMIEPASTTTDSFDVTQDPMFPQLDTIFPGITLTIDSTNTEEYADCTIYRVTYKDTDVVTILTKFKALSSMDYCETANQYGSDYALVYFVGGVPANSEEIYNAMLDNDVYGNAFKCEVINNTVNLFDLETGEEYEFEM